MKKQLRLSQFLDKKKEILPISPIDGTLFPLHGVWLIKSEYECLKELELLFNRHLSSLSATRETRQFGFLCENGHVIELKLTQVRLDGLIQVAHIPDSIGALQCLKNQ